MDNSAMAAFSLCEHIWSMAIHRAFKWIMTAWS